MTLAPRRLLTRSGAEEGSLTTPATHQVGRSFVTRPASHGCQLCEGSCGERRGREDYVAGLEISGGHQTTTSSFIHRHLHPEWFQPDVQATQRRRGRRVVVPHLLCVLIVSYGIAKAEHTSVIAVPVYYADDETRSKRCSSIFLLLIFRFFAFRFVKIIYLSSASDCPANTQQQSIVARHRRAHESSQTATLSRSDIIIRGTSSLVPSETRRS